MAKPQYEYIKQAYGVTFSVGDRVRLENTSRDGTVMREKPSHGHYVQVRFDDHGPGLCHPKSLIPHTEEPADKKDDA